MREFRVALALPDWIATALPPADARFPSAEERMDLVIRFAQETSRQTKTPEKPGRRAAYRFPA